MKKIADIVLSIVVIIMLGIVIIRPQIVDSAVLLEKKHPGYADWIMGAFSTYVDEDSEPYLLTSVVKDGFGAVEPEDISYYLKLNRNIHPEMKRIALRFDDGSGTGIEIIGDSAKYGSMDETGKLIDTGVNIDLTVPLINQIDGLTRLEREYDERGNLIYQFRRDGNGNGVADQYGVAGYRYGYDESGSTFGLTADNRISEQYLGIDEEPTECINGYSEVRREYDRGRLVKESYYNLDGELTNRSDFGYAYFINEYDDNWSLTYFYDKDDNYLQMGDSYFHEFLQSLKGKEFIVSIMDEGTAALTDTLREDLRELGITSEFYGVYRYSFYAIVTKDGVAEELSQDRLEYSGNINEKPLEVISSGWYSGGLSSIKIDSVEYSKNVRGMNFVVLEDGEIVESVVFDTFIQQIPVVE